MLFHKEGTVIKVMVSGGPPSYREKVSVMIKVRPPCADNQLFSFLVYHLRPTEWTVSTWIGSYKDMEPSPLVVAIVHPLCGANPYRVLHFPLQTDRRPHCIFTGVTSKTNLRLVNLSKQSFAPLISCFHSWKVRILTWTVVN